MFKNTWSPYYRIRIFETWEENRYKIERMDMRNERGRMMRGDKMVDMRCDNEGGI